MWVVSRMGGGDCIAHIFQRVIVVSDTQECFIIGMDTQLFAVDIACIQTCPVNALESIYNANTELGRI